MTAETLEAGPERPVRWWPLGLLVALLLVGHALWLVDRHLRGREADALLERVTTAQSAIAYADRRVGSTVVYAMPQLLSASTTPAVRESLQQLVQDAAATQVDRLVEVADDVERVDVLPWHGELEAARDACARYLQARATRLGEVARDADALYVSRPELDRDRARAQAALLRATHDPSAQRRVREVLASG